MTWPFTLEREREKKEEKRERERERETVSPCERTQSQGNSDEN
jgi:hypothetical protein